MSWWVEEESPAHFVIKSSRKGFETHEFRCWGGRSKANWLRDVLNDYEQNMPKAQEMLKYYFDEVRLPEIEKDVETFLKRHDVQPEGERP